MTVESVTQSVSNLALSFGDDDADAGAMVRKQMEFMVSATANTAEFLGKGYTMPDR